MEGLVQRGSVKILRMPWIREMVEVALGLGTIMILSWYVPSAWISSHLIFCALFLIVFAVAVRYHTVVAYCAGLLAALSYGLVVWQHPGMYMNSGIPYLALEPFLLLIIGIFVSDILRVQRDRLSTLEQKYTQTDEMLQKMYRRYQTLLRINEELERQVVGQPTSVAIISDKMACLWKLRGAERYAAILDMMVYAVGAQSCALYIKRNGLLRLCAAHSIESSAYASVLNVNDALAKHVIEHCEVYTVRDVLEREIISQKVAVMAGPLVDGAGQIIGIVIIDTMPLLKFTPSTVRLFSSILQLVSISLQTAVPMRENSEYQSIDPDITQPSIPISAEAG